MNFTPDTCRHSRSGPSNNLYTLGLRFRSRCLSLTHKTILESLPDYGSFQTLRGMRCLKHSIPEV